MRIELTKQEVLWLVDLTMKAKEVADNHNQENPHSIFELRRDNMASLENKLYSALQNQINKERKDAR